MQKLTKIPGATVDAYRSNEGSGCHNKGACAYGGLQLHARESGEHHQHDPAPAQVDVFVLDISGGGHSGPRDV